MTGVPEPAVGQLALDPDLEELGFEQIADANRQFRDAENAAHRDGQLSSR